MVMVAKCEIVGQYHSAGEAMQDLGADVLRGMYPPLITGNLSLGKIFKRTVLQRIRNTARALESHRFRPGDQLCH